MTTMRVAQASRANGPLELVERPAPDAAAGTVRIKVEVCGIFHRGSLTKEGNIPGIAYQRMKTLERITPASGYRRDAVDQRRGHQPAGPARLIALLGIASVMLAGTSNRALADEKPAWNGEVRTYGALHAIFHESQTGAMVRVAEVLVEPHVYAVGALADLAGEVTIVDGKVYLSYPDGDGTRTESPSPTDTSATLLVTAAVSSWHSVTTDRSIRFEELDAEIARHAVAAGLRTDRRFPFLVEGEVEGLEWHVIDGRRLEAGESSHHDHLAAGIMTRRDRTKATLVGFYSERDQGVFTHMGSNTHLHCVLDAPLASGHVDQVTIPAGATLKFPAAGD